VSSESNFHDRKSAEPCHAGWHSGSLVSPEDFTYVADLLRRGSGLVITPEKADLLVSRLMPLARQNGIDTLDELIGRLRLDENPSLRKAVIEAMICSDSFFFRDARPFAILNDSVLPALLERRRDRRVLRIWSAGCSTGQEPYSIAMVLKENEARLAGMRVEVVATDLSTEALSRAREGAYTQFEVQRGLPIRMLVKYFRQDGDRWRISSDLKGMVQFRQFSLLDDPSELGMFDIVFCRNVLIYFDETTMGEVLARIASIMPRDGYLFLGGAETVLGVSDRFKVSQPVQGVYMPS